MAQKFCWHYIPIVAGKILQLSNRRRNSDADSLENLSTNTSALTAHGDALAVLFDSRFLKRPQILLDVIPLELMSGDIKPTLQLFAQNQGQETAEDMPTDSFVLLVKDRAG
ncbi:MAG: hypothetical protein HN342_15235, partial [Nitrospina sp.]|nr:hypothetical protein [Nitrospina sp.]